MLQQPGGKHIHKANQLIHKANQPTHKTNRPIHKSNQPMYKSNQASKFPDKRVLASDTSVDH